MNSRKRNQKKKRVESLRWNQFGEFAKTAQEKKVKPTAKIFIDQIKFFHLPTYRELKKRLIKSGSWEKFKYG